MKSSTSFLRTFIVTLIIGILPVMGAPKSSVQKIDWSHYTGWEIWDYIGASGIMAKHAKKHGVDIKIELVNDYIPSINLYTGGEYVACTMTNMDALTTPCVGGIDSTVLILGSFSNGNDGVVLQTGNSLKDMKGQTVYLVEGSVSHYLLARGHEIEKTGLREGKDYTVANTLDSVIGGAFLKADPNVAVVTWNPILIETRNKKGAKLAFDSSKIPGEIMDLLVVRTNAPDGVKRALVGAWYEAMSIWSGQGQDTDAMVMHMAKSAGGTLEQFKAQVKTTNLFFNPKEAAEFLRSQKLKETMDLVRTFSYDHGLFSNATSKDAIGIEFADKSIMGNSKNVKLRFDPTYTELAAAGRL